METRGGKLPRQAVKPRTLGKSRREGPDSVAEGPRSRDEGEAQAAGADEFQRSGDGAIEVMQAPLEDIRTTSAMTSASQTASPVSHETSMTVDITLLDELISKSVARAVESVAAKISSLDERMQELEKTPAYEPIKTDQDAAKTIPEEKGADQTRGERSDAVRDSGENRAQPGVTSEPQVHPHEIITNEALSSKIEKDISEAFYYAIVLAPEALPGANVREILQETLALEQRGEFAQIPQTFIFKALQILRELGVHICKVYPSARSNLFHLLAGQKCECNAAVQQRKSRSESNRGDRPAAARGDPNDPGSSSSSSESSESGGTEDSESSSEDGSDSSYTSDHNHRGHRVWQARSRQNPGSRRSENVSRYFFTVSKLFANSLFRGSLDESIYLHLRKVRSTFSQIEIPQRYRGSLLTATLGGPALNYASDMWDSSRGQHMTWKRAANRLIRRYGSKYHIEAADAVLRELTFRKIIRNGDLFVEGMERLEERIRHLTSIVMRGKESQSDIKRALMYSISNEWFTSKLPSYMNSVEDVLLQVSRIVKSKRWVASSERENQKSFYRNLEGRQYAQPSAKETPSSSSVRKQNPVDSQGRVMLCRGCGSTEHFLLHCPKKKESMHAIFEQLSGYAPESAVSDGNAEDEEDSDQADANYLSQISDEEAANLSSTLNTQADVLQFGLETAHGERARESKDHVVEEFLGVCVDTGTTRTMIGKQQFLALCRLQGYTPKLKVSKRRFRCGNTVHESLGSFVFRLPVGDSFFVPVEVDVVDVANPFLLGLNDLHRMNAFIDLTDFSWSVQGQKKRLLVRDQHLWLPLSLQDSSCFTKAELALLHQRMGHPHPERLISLLKKATPADMNEETRRHIQEIADQCHSCQRTRPKPFVFRVSVPDEVVFGHELIIDLVKIGGRYVLHCVDRATGLNAAKVMSGESARDVWEALLEIWITKYVTPDVITTDAGSAFISKQFQDHVESFGSLMRAVPVESHSSLNRGEQAHGPLRKVYEKLQDGNKLTDEVRLALAVKAINEMPDARGFTPVQLVYGIVPNLPLKSHSPFVRQKERMDALQKAREEYGVIVAQERLKIAQDVRGPGNHVFEEGDAVLVFREDSKRWEGPARIVSIDAGNVIHVLQKGGKVAPFSRSSVRRFPTFDLPSAADSLQESTSSVWERSCHASLLLDSSGNAGPLDAHLSSYSHHVGADEILLRTETVANQRDPRFDEAKKKELLQLMERGTFRAELRERVPEGVTILRTKWVLVVKNPGTPEELYKARLVILGHRDPMKGKIVNEAPTLRSVSTRLIVCLASAKHWSIFSRDVTGAFLQSNSIRRKVFVELPKDALRLCGMEAENNGFVLLLPQYGLTDSPTYWWLRFRDYHLQVLNCADSAIDPCLFIHKEASGKADGVIGTLVDDTLGAGAASFLAKEEQCSQEFETKARTLSDFDFAGCRITQENASVTIEQRKYTEELQQLPKDSHFKSFQSARGKLQWLMQTRFDLAANVAKLSQVTEKTFGADCVALLNKTVREAQQNPCMLRIPAVKLSEAKIIVYCDASFASNSDLTSQLGFLIFLRDNDGKAALLDGGSRKCDRVTRSVMGAELYALAHGFDRALIIQDFLKACTQQVFGIVLATDSMGIFDAITRLSQFKEKRLLIDAYALRNAYSSGALLDIVHVRSEFNLADALTKHGAAGAKNQLRNVMNSGTLSDIHINRIVTDAADADSLAI